MTERWRKKLKDLDKVGPRDEVFERAKTRPVNVDDSIPRMATSTRVVTGVVAFAVFALALSVFAIPAFRMRGTPPSDGSSDVVALWPGQTQDAMQRLQQSADAGNASWALDPQLVAQKFGQQVMGWPDAVAKRNFDTYCFDATSGGSGAPVPCGQLQVGGSSMPGGGVPPAIDSPSEAPSGSDVRAYAVFPCAECRVSSGPEWVQVFQPVDRGNGAIWAVFQALGDPELSVSWGQTVHEGSTVSAMLFYFGGLTPTLGYDACGVGNATSELSGDATSARLTADVHLATSCTGEQPGYVWAAAASSSLADNEDPIDPSSGGGVELSSLTAVPVTMVLGQGVPATTPVATSPPPLSSPSVNGSEWSAYTDAFGWSIDVPPNWSTSVIDVHGPGTHGAVFQGADLSIQISTQAPAKGSPPEYFKTGIVDDSVFPLDAATLLSDDQPGLMGRFHGDGQEFTVSVMPQDLQGGLSPSDQDVVDRMIASISFDPWKVGDVRHDWVAIPTPTADISWLQIEGGWYMLFRTPDGDRLYGSISCAGAPPAKTGATSDGFAKLTCGDGSTWEMSADGASGGGGVASSSNDPPPEWPVVKAHDGTLIAFVLPGVFPEGTGGAS